MKFKQYMEYVSVHVPADSDKPTDIVQALACLLASRLSVGGRLPASCGIGDDLDMDIVQAGLLAGLEKIADYRPELGTSMRQFLYPTMAGAMSNYAWERENRVSDSRPSVGLATQDITSSYETGSSEEGDVRARELLPDALIEPQTPESMLMAGDAAETAHAGVRAAIAGIGKEATALLLRDAQIGYNAAARAAWAAEIGVSVGALSVRLSRLRRDARDWALTVQ